KRDCFEPHRPLKVINPDCAASVRPKSNAVRPEFLASWNAFQKSRCMLPNLLYLGSDPPYLYVITFLYCSVSIPAMAWPSLKAMRILSASPKHVIKLRYQFLGWGGTRWRCRVI